MTNNQNHLLCVVFLQFPAKIVNSSYGLFIFLLNMAENKQIASTVPSIYDVAIEGSNVPKRKAVSRQRMCCVRRSMSTFILSYAPLLRIDLAAWLP